MSEKTENVKIIGLATRRFRQVVHSIPNYFHQLTNLTNSKDIYLWLYYKFPYFFPVAKYPPVVTVELTNHCNFSCIHCFRNVMKENIGFIDLNLFKQIISELSRNPECILKLCGCGEPALHPQIKQMLDYLSKIPLRVVLLTNGSLLSAFTTQEIINWKINNLVISIDGINAKSYSYIRRGGDYDALRQGITKLYYARKQLQMFLPKIRINHVIFPNETSQQLKQFRKEWSQIVDVVSFNFLLPTSPEANEPYGLLKRCRDIRRELYIGWNGKVPLCGYQVYYGEREWLGDANISSLKKLWDYPRLKEVRNYHANLDFSKIPWCRYCVFTRG